MRLKTPFSYIYRTIIYIHAIHHGKNLNFSKLFGLEDGKKCQIPVKPFCEGVRCYSEFEVFGAFFFIFHPLQTVGSIPILCRLLKRTLKVFLQKDLKNQTGILLILNLKLEIT